MKIGNRQITEIYELIPTDGKQSFYGKAKVLIAEDGIRFLQSYNTIVAAKTVSGQKWRLYNEWTNTTGRHIKSFMNMNKDEFFKLPLCK